MSSITRPLVAYSLARRAYRVRGFDPREPPDISLLDRRRPLSGPRTFSGWAKAGWLILLIVFPLLGILLYVIVRHKGMMERAEAHQKAAKAEFDNQVRDIYGSGGPAQEIAHAKSLLDSGAITKDEFIDL
jgi:Phospholipase_D-nuclease N-terminal